MLSLLHPSSYVTDSSYPAQSSYGESEELNAETWPGSETVYPSPPMSSSPTGTFAGQRGFDPYTGRYVHQPVTAQTAQQWGHPVQYQGGYPQQQQQQHQQQLHHHHQHPHPHPHPHQHQVGPTPRSPRTQHGMSYAMPQQQVAQANYAYAGQQPQMVRGYPTPERSYENQAQPAQPTTVLGSSAPASKQTKQQRRTKPHVVTACYNCKKAHLSCEEQRPCQRCKSSGKTDSCFNVAHKRRGRPRIRDGNATAKTNTKHNGQGGPTAINTAARPAAQVKSTIDLGPDSAVSFNGAAHFDARSAEPPRAFLNPDFTILKVNQAFKGHFDYEHDPVSRSLEQLIDSSDKNTMTLLRDSLREERDVRKVSAYFCALKLEGGHDVNEVPTVESLDYTTVALQSFTLRDSNLRFRFRGNNVQNLTVTLQLAKADQFFVILTLPILQENTPATTSLPPTGTFHQPRSVPQVNTSSYALGGSGSFAASPSLYSTQNTMMTQHRLPMSAQSAPGSPYYALAPGPTSATAEPMTPSRSFDQAQGYYYAGTAYNYITQAGPPDQAMAAAAEPRHFPAYAPDSAQMQVHFPGGQQMLPPTFQLPPIIYGQQQQLVERPRSVHGPQIAYIPRDQAQVYGQGQLPVMRPMHHTAPVSGPQGSRKLGVQELVQ